jgi:hypothetical protein
MEAPDGVQAERAVILLSPTPEDRDLHLVILRRRANFRFTLTFPFIQTEEQQTIESDCNYTLMGRGHFYLLRK